MSLHLWISFVAATTVLLLIPGPTVLQCIGDALANRDRQSWSTILGVGVGDAIAMSLSLLGAGALLRTSAAAFTIMKTIGGAYLIYLGLRAIWDARNTHEPEAPSAAAAPAASAFVRFGKASTITMLNPKSILFFVAFVPQFISPQGRFFSQCAILLLTFVSLAMLNAWLYMSLAGVLNKRLQTRTAQKKVGYATGGVLFTAGTLTLALKRT
ncbi:LysE family translocator [Granulicella arctica]|uniref:LysE family translocator n=1 Tax=Granulicella arctica TaxID=940613 RepID=UPI0021DFEAC2|nr:LysE family translocator [Granulicella arctica]